MAMATCRGPCPRAFWPSPSGVCPVITDRKSFERGEFLFNFCLSIPIKKQNAMNNSTIRCSGQPTAPGGAPTVIKRPRGLRKPTMVIDAITVEKGKYGYEIESCINRLSALPPRGSIGRCMDSYKGKLTMHDFAIIFREFAQRGDWHRSLRLFKYMQRQHWCKPTEHIYTILIGILGREGLLDKCSEIFEEMPSNDVKWNVYSFTALINAYGRNGQYEAALHLLARMKREKVAPNLITYNTVINACTKGGLDWEGLLNLFAQMRHEGIQPDIITYNTLLSACSSRGLLEQAGMVFRTMNEAGVVPDTVTYTSLVATYKVENRLQGVEDLLREMEQAGNVPDVVGYNILIETYAAEGNVPKATAVFQRMQDVGCPPNVNTYSTLLEAYGKEGRYEDVRALFSDMKAKGTEPNAITFNTLIQVFGQGGYLKEALTLFHDMLTGNVEPDMDIYTSVLAVCAKGGLAKDATEIYRHILSSSSKLTLESHIGLVRSYGNAAMYQEASIAFQRMQELECKPDQSAFNALIETYAKGGLYTEATSAFWGMHRAGFPANVHTFNSLMEAYTKAGLYEDAVEFYQDMKIARCRPNEGTYVALLNTYGAMGQFDDAKAQFMKLREDSAVPKASVYCVMLSMCAKCHRWDYASKLLNEMDIIGGLHLVVAGILKEQYDKDYNWQIVEHAFDMLKLEDLVSSMEFFNALLDTLWAFGQKERAIRVLKDARRIGMFSEAFRKTKMVSSVDVHRMSTGGALAAISTWLGEMQLHVACGEDLPSVNAIVILWGKVGSERPEKEPPLARAVHRHLMELNAPFEFALWNGGRLVSRNVRLKPWLSKSSVSGVLSVANTPLSDLLTSSDSRMDITAAVF